jgi:hypothetical protein
MCSCDRDNLKKCCGAIVKKFGLSSVCGIWAAQFHDSLWLMRSYQSARLFQNMLDATSCLTQPVMHTTIRSLFALSVSKQHTHTHSSQRQVLVQASHSPLVTFKSLSQLKVTAYAG